MRSRADRPVLAALFALTAGGAGGCLGEGQPWGLVEVRLAVGFEVGATRLEGGRLKTARDYRVAVESVELRIEELELVAASGTSATFDPSRPPAGYSLCHNGHCHADDGRLVDYEDIIRELAGGEGAAVLLSLPAGTGRPALDGREAVELAACREDSPCPIDEPVTVGLVRASVGRVVLRGVAYDARQGGAARLGEAGRPFEVALDGGIGALFTLSEPVRLRFGPGERLGLSLGVVVELPAEIFDGIEWATMDAEALAAAVEEAVRENTGLAVSARRFE